MCTSVGAYGFRFDGIAGPLLQSVPTSWPRIQIQLESGVRKAPTASVDDSNAEFPLLDDGSVFVRREPPQATYHLRGPIGGDELAHPYLAPVAAVHAYWNGFEAFHAGGFVADTGAWAILASRRGGKSSMLAALAVAGLPVVSDDLFVVDHERVFAGPRSIDLRPDAAPHFPSIRTVGTAGRRHRWRLDPGEIPPETPLAGWLLLNWGDELSASPIEAGERIRRLAASKTLRGPNPDPSLLLRLAAYPMFTITRPRGWDRMDDALGLVLQTVA